MAYKFITPAKRETLNMVKVDIDGTVTWATCSKAVKTYAKNHFKEGDEVEFEYEEKDGKYNITGYIKAVGAEDPTPEDTGETGDTGTSSEEAPEFTCEDCGTVLKNGKYKKCYTCNQKAGSSKEYSPEVNESIKRQAIGHMTSRVIFGLQGHVDLNNVNDVIEKVYKKFQELVG